MNVLPLILRRARRYWQILLTLLFGVVLAAVLLASGPLVVSTVQDAALPFALRGDSVLDGNLRITVYLPPDSAKRQTEHREILDLLDQHLTHVAYDVLPADATPFMYPWINGQPFSDQRINLRSYSAAPETLTVLEGTWPEGIRTGNTLPVAIGVSLAQTYALEVGDLLPLSLRPRDEKPALTLEIAAIVQPALSNDPRWQGIFNPFREQGDERYPVQFSALVDPTSLMTVMQRWLIGSRMETSWHVMIDPTSLQASELADFQVQLANLQSALVNRENRVILETNLTDVLERIEQQYQGIQLPLYFLLLEVLLLALYYIMMVSGLYVSQVEGEFARLGSRGAALSQVTRLQLVEASLLALIGLVSGPLLAYTLIQGLAKWGPLASVLQFAQVNIGLPLASWLAVTGGGIFLILALLIPALPAVRRGVVVHLQQRARNDRPPLWQRLYLDVFLFVGSLILLWRAFLTGGFSRVDWLLLAAPLALLIGSATILLRLLPPILGILARIAARGRSLALPLALQQAARSPNHITRLVLLLTLTMALGILATGLNATLVQSDRDRAVYAAGSALRLAFDNFVAVEDLAGQPGVHKVAAAWRVPAVVNVRTYRSFPSFDLLAIEPFSMADVVVFRSDYSEIPMGEQLGKLVVDPDQVAPVLPLPDTARRVGFWLATLDAERLGYNPLEYLSVQIKIKTAVGQMLVTNLNLAKLETDVESENGAVWGLFEGVLPELLPEQLPVALHSIWFRSKFVSPEIYAGFANSRTFAIDDLLVVGEDGAISVVEDFSDPTRIWQTNAREFLARYSTRIPYRSPDAAIRLDLPYRPGTAYSFSLADITRRVAALPVLASPAFLEITGLNIEDLAQIQFLGTTKNIQIKGMVNYFPTLYDQPDHAFLVTSSIPLLNELNGQLARPFNPNEYWVKLEPGQPAQSVIDMYPTAERVWELNAELARIQSDPFSLGLRTVTILGTLVTFLLSLVGFLTYFILSARQRATVYGILRSLGLSPTQLYGSLIIEQIVLITAGVGLGVLLGVLLNRLILPDLPLVLGDTPPVPPFQVRENWNLVLQVIGGLSLAYLITLAMGTALLWRTEIHRILRIGEE
jgi:hypothetical protein